MNKQHYTLSVIFIITVLLFTSCNKGNGELIYEGDFCNYSGCKEVYLKNTSFDKIITFTIESKEARIGYTTRKGQEEIETHSLVVTLNPGARKKIGCTCNGFSFPKYVNGAGSPPIYDTYKWNVSYKIVGAIEEK